MADEDLNYDDDISLDELIGEDEEIEYDEEVDSVVQETGIDNNIITVKVSKPEDRITRDTLTKYELAAVIGMRATQISQGDEYFIDPDPTLTDPIAIAERELKSNRCPLILERLTHKSKNGNSIVHYVEHWKVREMQYNFKD